MKISRTLIFTLLLTIMRSSAAPVPLFDGKTFAGWEGDTAKTWPSTAAAWPTDTATATPACPSSWPAAKRTQEVFVRYAFRFFLGRNETVRDAKTLQEANEAYTASDGSMKALVVSLLSSDSFLYRSVEP